VHAPVPDTTQSTSDEADVERVLKHLTDRQRAAFDLYYRKGMTHEEVASALELPLGTVKSDLARGLDRLRSLFVERERN
jgi:RNA polymerase sigma-70 factor (ECF subfamily)